MTEAVCTVAPEWWGAGRDDEADLDMALWGCRICPVTDCLQQFADATGPLERVDDLGQMVVAGMYGWQLFGAVNEIAKPPVHVRPYCGTVAAYKAHRRAGETPCAGCRWAQMEAQERSAVRNAA